jgi:hypothetical protein
VRKTHLVILLILFNLQAATLCAQRNRLSDSLLVIAVCTGNRADTVAFHYVKTGRQISWWDFDNHRHESKLNHCTKDYLILDSSRVDFYNITGISTLVSTKKDKTNPLSKELLAASEIYLHGNQSVMTRFEYEKMLRWWNFRKSMREKEIAHAVPGFMAKATAKANEISKESFLKDEDKIAYKYAMKDTTRKQFDSIYKKTRYYSMEFNQKRKNRRYLEYLKPHCITVGLTDPLANELTLNYSYRISRLFGVEISPGIYFSSNKKNPMMPDPSYIEHCSGLNYHRCNNNGYQVNLTGKFYFPNKPNRYIGIKAFYRYFSYDQKAVGIYILYHDSAPVYAIQSETSNVMGFSLIYGWQFTAFKLLNFDFYLGLGAFKREGNITEYSGGFHGYEYSQGIPVEYPNSYYVSAWFPSFQGGVKMGIRFGKRKQ